MRCFVAAMFYARDVLSLRCFVAAMFRGRCYVAAMFCVRCFVGHSCGLVHTSKTQLRTPAVTLVYIKSSSPYPTSDSVAVSEMPSQSASRINKVEPQTAFVVILNNILISCIIFEFFYAFTVDRNR